MESVPEQTACIDLTDTDVLWDFICRNESLSLFESIFFMVFQIQPSANDSFRHIKSHRTLAINAMKRIIGRGLKTKELDSLLGQLFLFSFESIFFMVSGTANRIFEMLWNLPKIPQKSVAVFH